jgi:hypothetical protein
MDIMFKKKKENNNLLTCIPSYNGHYKKWSDYLDKIGLKNSEELCTCNPFWDFTDNKCFYCQKIFESCATKNFQGYAELPNEDENLDMDINRIINLFIFINMEKINIEKNRKEIYLNIRKIFLGK